MDTAWMRDTLERTIATYLQALIGLLIASWSGAIDLATLQTAAWAAIPAALAVLKAAIASRVGDTVSPASLVHGGAPAD
jgi:hypothetical protein